MLIVFDENYLTKLTNIDPDSKALDIEAMLAAELKIRVDEDPQAEPLSEKLKRIINLKRNGALQGIHSFRHWKDWRRKWLTW